MGTKRISDLPVSGASAETDLYPVVQGASTNRQSLPALRAALGVNINNFANLAGSADQIAYFSGVGVLSLATLTAQARTLLAALTQADQRTALGLTLGGANGIAQLGADGLLPPALLPALAVNDVFTVANQAAMLALTAQRGDVAIRTDLSGAAYILSADAPATLANWKAIQQNLGAALQALAALTPAADKIGYFTGAGSAALADFPTQARTFLAASTLALQKAALGGVLAQADKPTWTAYTPVVTANTGTFTNVTANGSYLVLYGMCHVRITISFTTLGNGGGPTISLPFAALAGTAGMPMAAQKITGLPARSGTARVTSALNVLALIGSDGAELGNADGNVVTIMGSYPIA